MRLIVNADDLGYTAGVTSGIVRALRGSRYARERGVELETLTDPRVRPAIGRLGIELVRYDAL